MRLRPRIYENHVVEFDDRDEAISRGYRPCQKCLP
ncbi:Ada metal-binding domain-containing protein [Mitsuokella multacida]